MMPHVKHSCIFIAVSFGKMDLQLLVQPVPITTNVVGSNSAQARCTRYNIM